MTSQEIESQAEELARQIAKHLRSQDPSLSDSGEHHLDHMWIRAQRRRCEVVSGWIGARLGEAARWLIWGALIGAGVAITEGGRSMIRRWLGME